MALTKVETGGIKDDAVTAGKIPANAIGSSEIAANAVGQTELADDAVAHNHLADNAILAAAISDDQITEAKLDIHADPSGTDKVLGYTSNGMEWIVAAAGATGGGTDKVFWENGQTVTTDYTITNGQNAGTWGPVTINSGVTVTVGDGEYWTIM
mgnify:CR=1 FL=1